MEEKHMQSEQIAGILALLETIGKGMEYLQSHEDAKTAFRRPAD